MASSSLRQATLPQMQVPRPADLDEEVRTPEEVEAELAARTIEQLLVEAQSLYTIRDPANMRLNYIKNTLVSRLSPTFDEHNQLQLFDELNGLAFRDADDPQLIVIQSPNVPLQFRLRKQEVRQWKVVLRTVAQEMERRTHRLEQLVATPAALQGDIQQERAWVEALQWVLNQTDARKNYRLVGRFVASSERELNRVEDQE